MFWVTNSENTWWLVKFTVTLSENRVSFRDHEVMPYHTVKAVVLKPVRVVFLGQRNRVAIIVWSWSGLLVSGSSWKWFRVSSCGKQQVMVANEAIMNRWLPVSEKSLVIAIACSDAHTCGACRTESLPIRSSCWSLCWFCDRKSACRS